MGCSITSRFAVLVLNVTSATGQSIPPRVRFPPPPPADQEQIDTLVSAPWASTTMASFETEKKPRPEGCSDSRRLEPGDQHRLPLSLAHAFVARRIPPMDHRHLTDRHTSASYLNEVGITHRHTYLYDESETFTFNGGEVHRRTLMLVSSGTENRVTCEPRVHQLSLSSFRGHEELSNHPYRPSPDGNLTRQTASHRLAPSSRNHRQSPHRRHQTSRLLHRYLVLRARLSKSGLPGSDKAPSPLASCLSNGEPPVRRIPIPNKAPSDPSSLALSSLSEDMSSVYGPRSLLLDATGLNVDPFLSPHIMSSARSPVVTSPTADSPQRQSCVAVFDSRRFRMCTSNSKGKRSGAVPN